MTMSDKILSAILLRDATEISHTRFFEFAERLRLEFTGFLGFLIELCVINETWRGTLKPGPEFVEGLFGGVLGLPVNLVVSFVLKRSIIGSLHVAGGSWFTFIFLPSPQFTVKTAPLHSKIFAKNRLQDSQQLL